MNVRIPQRLGQLRGLVTLKSQATELPARVAATSIACGGHRALSSGFDPLSADVQRISLNVAARESATRLSPALQWEAGSVGKLSELAKYRKPSPYVGRSVMVEQRNNPARAFQIAYRRLGGVLRENNVAATVRYQERHEKKGVKRRRLASLSHRRKFAQLVRAKVALVKKIRARGS